MRHRRAARSRRAGRLLKLIALRLQLDGVALRPAWFHVAWASRYGFRFLDPERQGRFFMGMIEQKASLPDQNPSGMTNFVGIGYDSADSQLHIMHNDGSGSATKVALGASFPKPTSDNSVWYRLRLTAPAGTTRTIDWEVTELQTGAVASGTITTDLPATDKFVSPAAFNGVGGVSAPISLVLGNYVVYS